MLKICLSGGPCAGKSTSMSFLYKELTEKLHKKVFIVQESATELILSGIFPCEEISTYDFQELVFENQLQSERIYDGASKYYDSDDVVIICDRGFLDQMAYIDREGFDKILNNHNMSLSDITKRYDVLIHMVTAANGTDCYTKANNCARRESKEEAILADNRTLEVNMLHSHVKIVDNNVDSFESKLKKVRDIVFKELGVPVPTEIERKFLISKPKDEFLNSMKFSYKTNIIQTYLKSDDPEVERRVRQRGNSEDGYTFYYTEKVPVSDIERIEREKKISSDEYIRLLSEADTSLHQINKARYCFIFQNQYFEIDLYPFSDEYAIMEIELVNQDDKVVLPDFIHVISDVTDDNRFKNYNIAKTMKLER